LCEPGLEKESGGDKPSNLLEPSLVFTQCSVCGELLEKQAVGDDRGRCGAKCTPQVVQKPVLTLPDGSIFDGVSVVQEFISREQEQALVEAIDKQPWVVSQSGRRKQVSGHAL
jgi:hypothetical protein